MTHTIVITPSSCRLLQCVAVLVDTCCSLLASCSLSTAKCVVVCCGVLRCIAVCCSVFQCVAVCSSVLHCVAVCCSAVQYVNCRHTGWRRHNPSTCVTWLIHICKVTHSHIWCYSHTWCDSCMCDVNLYRAVKMRVIPCLGRSFGAKEATVSWVAHLQKRTCKDTPSTLQHTATYCNRYCNTQKSSITSSLFAERDLFTHPQTSAIRNTLRHTATRCNIYCDIHRNTLQYIASHCNTLQHTALSSVERDMPYLFCKYTAWCPSSDSMPYSL